MLNLDQLRGRSRTVLYAAIELTLSIHIALLLLLPDAVFASNLMIALAPMVSAACVLWRCSQVEPSERSAWLWIATSSVLWATGQLLELNVRTMANNEPPQIADFFFFIVSIPLLLAVSSTPATRSVRRIRFLNALQAILAVGLIYVRLFKMTEASGHRLLDTVYGVELSILAAAVLLRWVAASTSEDRRCMGLVAGFLLAYSPMEIIADALGNRWNLQGGTLLDICWTLPFLLFGLFVLLVPIDHQPAIRRDASDQRFKLLLQSLCPALFTCCVFALAASIVRQHFLLAFAAMLLSLLIQGLHSAVMQVDYLVGRDHLLHQEERLIAANASLEKLSFLDPLTGIPNRRHLTEVLEMQHRRAIRQREWISILMVDIDHFKSVNDLQGHAYGDECLVGVAQALRAELKRPSDMVARYGGDEFVVLLPGTDLSGAYLVASRLHAAIAALVHRKDASPLDLRLTVSIGVAATCPEAGEPISVVLEAADQALYQAKEQGRNRSCTREVAKQAGRKPDSTPSAKLAPTEVRQPTGLPGARTRFNL